MAEVIDTDRDYDELPLEAVEKQGKGYVLKRDGMSLYIDDPGFEPKAGMIARYYGAGVGYAVRGVMIDGKVCRYQTAEEERVRQEAEAAKWEAERIEHTKRVEASGRTENGMRDETAPTPKTIEELTAYVQKQVSGPHDYGTCVYAMSLSATAAFNFAAGQLGVTGFQASCADLDVLRRTRSIDGPFIILKAYDALYPQMDLREKLEEALREWEPWLQEEAKKFTRDSRNRSAHPNVRKHWEALAK